MVIRVHSNVFQVIVLAPGTNALLGVRRPGIASGNGAGPFRNVRTPLTQEDRHELIHSRVGEQQVGRVGHQTRRRHDGVAFGLEEIQERLTYFQTRHIYEPKRVGKPKTQDQKGIFPPTATVGSAGLCKACDEG